MLHILLVNQLYFCIFLIKNINNCTNRINFNCLFNSDEAMEGLIILKSILPVVGFESSAKILEAIHPLLVSAGLELRLCISDILESLVLIDSSMAFVVILICYFIFFRLGI